MLRMCKILIKDQQLLELPRRKDLFRRIRGNNMFNLLALEVRLVAVLSINSSFRHRNIRRDVGNLGGVILEIHLIIFISARKDIDYF
jgi:hypothetical protein